MDSATGERGAVRTCSIPETVDATIEVRSVGLVSIPYQVPSRVPWKSIDHLLRRPFSRRMLGDIEMNDTATLVAKDDEDEQNSEGCGRQSEKVERHQVVCMIIEKAPPSMERWGCDDEPYTWRRRPGKWRCLASPARHARGELPREGWPCSCSESAHVFRERRLVVRAYAVGSSKSNIV